ncbi:MAG: SDR family oxidoreductase [Solirubrobacterales bacterium]|nr:SDR family oxidoreductase [Solirubrobacterales bacterium]
MSLPDPSPRRAALVTGASAGIGAAIAAELARRGHGLVLVARRQDRLDELAASLSHEHGVRAEALGCDLADAESVKRLPTRVEALELTVDVLVNNAGFATNGPFERSDPDRELEQVRVLVEAPVALCSAFLPGMVSRHAGAVLTVASTAGMQPLPYSAGYSAAKAHALTFSEALHQELKGSGVTVTALAPGPVQTDFWAISGWEVGSGQTFSDALPRPGWVTPEHAAAAAVAGLERGRRVVVPGAPIRAAMAAGQFVPNVIKLPLLEWVNRRR